MPITDIQNFLQISPNLLTAGQPLAGQFTSIRESGCSAVINLALDNSPDAFPGESTLAQSLGMEYFHISIDWEHPQPSHLEAFFGIMDRLKDQTLFIHCARNMRVSAFVFLYRVLRLNENRARAEADLHKIWLPDQTWQEFIDEALMQHKNNAKNVD